MKTKTKLLFLFTILVVVDQISKYFSSISVCNKNIAWNIPLSPAIFYLAWIVITIGLIYMLSRTEKYYQKIFLILIISGAISNMLDRIRFSCVVDFIDLKFWPVFNLADIYISVGTILLLASILNSQSQKTNVK